jgi:cytochrome c
LRKRKDAAAHSLQKLLRFHHRRAGMAAARRVLHWAIASALFAAASHVVFAQLPPAALRGLVFVRTHCAGCHAIDRVSPSPLSAAPPFREVHRRYPVEMLEQAFAEGIRTGHPSMPEFRLDAAQIGDLIAFLKSLE